MKIRPRIFEDRYANIKELRRERFHPPLSNSKFEKICPAIPKSIQIVSNLNAFTHKKRFQTAIPYL
ncbi:MAG: hypothetical protein LBQ57_03205, partial [Spirochaetales bacterium]|nr:hypothetical protein [Spirochaetales bacterium]